MVFFFDEKGELNDENTGTKDKGQGAMSSNVVRRGGSNNEC